MYDNGTFAGDARMPDIKPNETRLISYAIDLGTEVVPQAGAEKRTVLGVSVGDGRVYVQAGLKRTTTYLIRNRNPQDRTVIVEHPQDRTWKLVSPAKADDQTRSFHRFEVAVKSGALNTLEVTEESGGGSSHPLASAGTDEIRGWAALKETKPAVREVFKKLLDLRGKVDEVQKGIADEQAALKEIAEDQERLRKNIERAPKESETFKRYLKKFDDQETEIEKRQTRVRELKADLLKHEKALKEFAETAKAE